MVLTLHFPVHCSISIVMYGTTGNAKSGPSGRPVTESRGDACMTKIELKKRRKKEIVKPGVRSLIKQNQLSYSLER